MTIVAAIAAVKEAVISVVVQTVMRTSGGGDSLRERGREREGGGGVRRLGGQVIEGEV